MIASKPPYIRMIEVNKYFDLPSGRFTALDQINLEFFQGEFTSVVGRSGSGKSTLMNMITGIDKPSSGEIQVNGMAIHRLKENEMARWRGKNLGIVFQFYQLIPVLTLVENVMLPMQLLGERDQEQIHSRANELLSKVNLAEFSYAFPHPSVWWTAAMCRHRTGIGKRSFDPHRG